MQRPILIAGLLAIVLAAFAFPACAQDQDNNQGPMAPPPKFEIKRMPSTPHPGPPPIPEQTIIQKFAANEDAAKKVYETYNFEQMIRLEELNGPGGKFIVDGEQYTKSDGERVWRVTKQVESSLKLTSYRLDDLQTILSVPLFFLTTDQIPGYNIVYAGQQKIDEINTYIFQVKPKTLDRARLFFEGIVYVDDQDLAIVETYGKFENEMGNTAGTKLPFTLFETYRENFQGKYWLPTYTTSDDYIDVKADEPLHLRIVVRASDFKLRTPRAPFTLPDATTPTGPSDSDSLPHLPPPR